MSTPTPRTGLAALTLGSIGVVYGDIGTSPLYAFRESLAAAAGHGNAPEPAMVLGVLSLILWSLILIVTVKYVLLLMRADNEGEGGILSLMALAQQALGRKGMVLLTLGMTGTALFYGDALITPAISVLSALEGLKLITPHLTPYILPLALCVMIGLFLMQARGTAKVARFFGPLMLVWFIALFWGGLRHVQDAPEVLQAFNPVYGITFLTQYGLASLIALGAVFLAVTGGEALYADLGHFGKRSIRTAWGIIVMPALMMNYLGQAAMVLSHPEHAANSFFLLYPDWALAPMVGLATLATIIASQAVITGAYSLTHQAVQLGLLPRLHVRHTSQEHAGQIYMPQVNWLLLGGVLLLILLFRTSSSLASAYGIAVTGTMVITALLAFIVMRHKWRWPLPLALAVIIPLLLIDLSFLSANMLKLLDGGYVPVVLSILMVIAMRTWVRGCRTLHEEARDYSNSMEAVINSIDHYPPKNISGTAIYLTSNPLFAPTALVQNLKHNKVLHEENLLLTLHFVPRPHVPAEEKITLMRVCERFTRVTLNYGFMETPNVVQGLQLLRQQGALTQDLMNISFFISRRHIVPSARYGMPLWQDRIFIALNLLASDAADYFHLPRSRVVELGSQMTV